MRPRLRLRRRAEKDDCWAEVRADALFFRHSRQFFFCCPQQLPWTQAAALSMVATPSRLESINTTAVVLKDEGRYSEARDYLHGGLRAARQILGDDHPTTLSMMNNLAALLQLTGKLAEAEPLCQEVLALSLALSINGTLFCLSTPASPSQRNAVWPLSLVQVLAARRSILGDAHVDTINSLVNVGTLHESLGSVDEALKCRREVVATRRKTLGDDDKDTLSALSSLAKTLFLAQRVNEGLEAIAESLEGNVKHYGRNCAAYLPAETKQIAAHAADAMAALPDKGEGLTARARFFLAGQEAVTAKPVVRPSGSGVAASAAPPFSTETAPAEAAAPAASAAISSHTSATAAAATSFPSSQPPASPNNMSGLLQSVGCEEYIAIFEEEEMELRVMRDVMRRQGRAAVDDCLKELGVTSLGQRTKIANALL